MGEFFVQKNKVTYKLSNGKELIDTYIETFAGCSGPKEDLEYILREWDTQKEKLYHLFGDNFILKKEIAYSANEDDLIDRIVNIKRSSIFIKTLKTLSITYKEKGDSLIQNHKFIFSDIASLILLDFLSSVPEDVIKATIPFGRTISSDFKKK